MMADVLGYRTAFRPKKSSSDLGEDGSTTIALNVPGSDELRIFRMSKRLYTLIFFLSKVYLL